MNVISASLDTLKERAAFLPASDWLAVILLALSGALINYIPYSSRLSILLQAFLLGMVFLLYRSRPVMLIVAYILLRIMPSSIYGGFGGTAQGYYALNSKISIAFALLFIFYGLVILKRSYRIELSALILVLFIISSLTWTVSGQWYDMDLWWMCLAYLVFPMFIKEDNDLRLTLIAYVVAVDVFCVLVLPVLLVNTDLYRGTIRLDPNYAAFFVLISIAIILTMLTQYSAVISGKLKILLSGSAVLAVITMAIFASRTSFIILGFLVIAYLLFNFKDIKTVAFSSLGIVALFYVLNYYGFFDNILLRFGLLNTGTGGERLIIQQQLLKSLFGSDLLRVLFGNGYLTASYFGLKMQAHNTYVSVLHGFGMLGFLTYLAYLLNIFFGLNRGYYRSFLIMFFFLCLYGLALEPYHMWEGITFFAVLSGIPGVDYQPGLGEMEELE